MAGQSSSPDSQMPADTAGTGAWIGKTISHRYQIDSLLGAGGMGFVYRAIDTNLDTHVVLKVPKRILLENPVFTERFVREIRALVSLSHPHVVKILDVGKHEDVPFAVMQYLPGGDLNDRRQGNGKSYVPMPVRIAMGDWLRQVAGAIDFVHDRGFVHRDIKPGNILFDTYGNAYLGDFGVAKVVTETQSNNDLDALTGEGLVLGTMDYMAPELAKGGKITSAVDQYALAVTIFEILAGRKPFVGRTKELALVARLTTVAPNIQTVFRDVPELMAVVIAKGLAIKPLDRYPNCSQFAEALLAAIPLGEMSEDRSVPASAKLACPSCNAVLTAKAFVIGKSIPCPKCRESIVADDRLTHLMKSVDAADLLKVRTSTVDEKSLVKLPCPKCETVMKIGPEAAGRNAPCPSCGIKLRIAIDRRSLQEVFPSSQVGSETPDSAQETVQGKFPVGATAFDVQKQKRESTPVAVPIAVPKIIHSLAPRQPFPDSSSNSSFDNSEYINDILPEFNRSTPLDFSTKRILRFALAGAVLFVVMIICIEAWKLYQKFENTMDEGALPAKSSVPKPLVPPKPVDSSSIDQKKSATSIVPVPGSAQRAVETKIQKATNSIGMKFVEIPTGEFMMGEGDDAVAVTLTKPFLLGKYEVTQGQWKKVMNLEPWAGQGGVQIRDDNPASYVNWDDATDFCKKLSAIERKAGKLKANEEYRLPTEAEWEYACRAGTKTDFSFGDDLKQLDQYGWFDGNAKNVGLGFAHKVAIKKPNPWGLHDMHGNVLEWCSDWYDEKLSGGIDPVGPGGGSRRVLRGGSWGNYPGDCRSASHKGDNPPARNDYLGFRVARSQSETVTRSGMEKTQPVRKVFKSGESVTNSIGMKLIGIPAGTFTMGDGAGVAVTLTQGFSLGKTEVTWGEWQRVMGKFFQGKKYDVASKDFPASGITWDEAIEFCQKLTATEHTNGRLPAGESYRLPSEAEWECACRAGTETAFSFGDDESKLSEYAWFDGNALKVNEPYAHKVGLKRPNPWGLYDMHGNVLEFCSDWYGEAPSGGTNPVGPERGSIHVIRGGGWGNDPVSCRSAYRGSGPPSTRIGLLGFRVARSQSTQ